MEARHAEAAADLMGAEFGLLGLSLNAETAAGWSPGAGIRGSMLAALQYSRAYYAPVLWIAIPSVRAS